MGGEALGRVDPNLLLALGSGLLSGAPTGDFAGGFSAGAQNLLNVALQNQERKRREEEETRRRTIEDEDRKARREAQLRDRLAGVRDEIARHEGAVEGLRGKQEERDEIKFQIMRLAELKPELFEAIPEGDFSVSSLKPKSAEALNIQIAAMNGQQGPLMSMIEQLSKPPKEEKPFSETFAEQQALATMRAQVQQKYPPPQRPDVFPTDVGRFVDRLTSIEDRYREEIRDGLESGISAIPIYVDSESRDRQVAALRQKAQEALALVPELAKRELATTLGSSESGVSDLQRMARERVGVAGGQPPLAPQAQPAEAPQQAATDPIVEKTRQVAIEHLSKFPGQSMTSGQVVAAVEKALGVDSEVAYTILRREMRKLQEAGILDERGRLIVAGP